MRTEAYMLLLALSLNSCNGQDKSKDKIALNNATIELNDKGSLEPKGNWTVNKEFDENGNIIRYDSIYSYSYSSRNGDTVAIKDVDSVIQSFQNYFEHKIPKDWGQSFMNPYWNDSLLFDNFFEDNYFHDRWKDDFFDMESRFLRMDSLRNKYLREFYPELNKNKEPNDR